VALLALRRPRNLVPVVLSYLALYLLAIRLGDPSGVLLVLAPAPVLGARLAGAVGAREETAGALVTATIFLSLAFLSAAPVATSVGTSVFAFLLGAALAGSSPTLRDAVLPVLDGARYAAIALLLGTAIVLQPSLLDIRAVGMAAAVLVIGTITAAVGARLFGGDPLAAAIGGGMRDPAVAAGLVIGAGLAGGSSLPVAYAALAVLALALGKLLIRRKA
jgi:hypothetical protein